MQSKDVKAGNWTLDWGGLRLIIIEQNEKLQEYFHSNSAHTFGVIVDALAYNWSSVSETMIRESGFHSVLIQNNHERPSNPVSFVFIKGYTQQVFKIEEILYIEIPVFSTPSGPLHAYRIDVDVETIVATATDTGREIVLKAPPLQEKRTCEECRRLADQGAYEESIAAYREFILNNEGHFQIDDAYYAIAEIFDTKLFQYNDALYWYSQLLEKYSQSSLSSMARQRAEYLRLYDDFDFIPLSQFERIRRVEYFRHKKDPEQRQALINRVKQIILDYPDSTIRPSIHYWLANQLRDIDIDDAVAEYEVLLKEFPVLLDYNSAAGIKYDVDEVPVTVIIGPEGRLLFKRTGYSPAVKRQLFSKLESLVEQT